jgi:hypothetical protein
MTEYIEVDVTIAPRTLYVELPEKVSASVELVNPDDTYIERNGDAYIARNGDTYIAHNTTTAYPEEINVKKPPQTIYVKVNNG